MQQRTSGSMLQYFNYLVEDPYSKMQKLQVRIDQAERDLVLRKAEMTEKSASIQTQVEMFHSWKNSDFQLILTTYVKNQIEFHNKVQL